MTTSEENNAPIGFFDSGVGGLSVLKEVKKLLPNENYLYYGDTVHVPYGEKTKEQLISYSKNILKFFYQNGCKAVVMACNTTSSTVYNDIKNLYGFKLYPIVQSVAKVLSLLDIERLGIFATKSTINSHAYPNEISKFNSKIKVYGQYCPDWAGFVEKNIINEPQSIEVIKSDLDKMLKNKPDKIVLGCTHYPYLLPVLSEFAPENLFIDPAKPFAKYIADDLKSSKLLSTSTKSGNEEFYVSSNPQQFKKAAKMFYPIDKEVRLLRF
ncbi:MAG: glutamate racemase [Cyanobacteriota bacterium]|nr:glutamate racemase [Cyanobacteriota bacterium]